MGMVKNNVDVVVVKGTDRGSVAAVTRSDVGDFFGSFDGGHDRKIGPQGVGGACLPWHVI